MGIGMNAFRPNDGVDDQIEAGERFTGSPGFTYMLWFGQNKNRRAGRRWGCHSGVLQSRCVFWWKALVKFQLTGTESNREVTNPKSADHGGVLHGGVKNKEKGNLGLRECSSEIEPIAQSLRCGMRWRSRTPAQFIGHRPELDEDRGFPIALASLLRGGFRWWHGGRRLTGACHLSNFLPRRRGPLPRPPTTHPELRWHPYRRRGADLHLPPDALYHGNPPSVGLSEWFETKISPNSIWHQAQTPITKLFLYNGSTTLLYWLGANSLDLSIYRAPKLTQYPISLNFQTPITWQLDFECVFLSFLHNNHAYTLKQCCSLSYTYKVDVVP
jgi:hypothetical protein